MIKSQSQFETLKGKFREKILSSKRDFPIGLNDTEIIKRLENKVMEFYHLLNLNTNELINLKKITFKNDEYIVFLKILVDRLSSETKSHIILQKEKTINQQNINKNKNITAVKININNYNNTKNSKIILKKNINDTNTNNNKGKITNEKIDKFDKEKGKEIFNKNKVSNKTISSIGNVTKIPNVFKKIYNPNLNKEIHNKKIFRFKKFLNKKINYNITDFITDLFRIKYSLLHKASINKMKKFNKKEINFIQKSQKIMFENRDTDEKRNFTKKKVENYKENNSQNNKNDNKIEKKENNSTRNFTKNENC